MNSITANPLEDKCNLFLKTKERENFENQKGLLMWVTTDSHLGPQRSEDKLPSTSSVFIT